MTSNPFNIIWVFEYDFFTWLAQSAVINLIFDSSSVSKRLLKHRNYICLNKSILRSVGVYPDRSFRPLEQRLIRPKTVLKRLSSCRKPRKTRAVFHSFLPVLCRFHRITVSCIDTVFLLFHASYTPFFDVYSYI